MPMPNGRDAFDFDAFWATVVAYRERHRLAWDDLAALCGMDRRTVLRIKEGKHVPSINVLARFAVACDISIDKYLREDAIRADIDAA